MAIGTRTSLLKSFRVFQTTRLIVKKDPGIEYFAVVCLFPLFTIFRLTITHLVYAPTFWHNHCLGFLCNTPEKLDTMVM